MVKECLRILAEGKDCTLEDMASRLSCSGDTLKQMLLVLVRGGYLECQDDLLKGNQSGSACGLCTLKGLCALPKDYGTLTPLPDSLTAFTLTAKGKRAAGLVE